ncbi:Beta-xylosidase/alpha-L-arabinofuranosidase 2 [Phytophthora cactorum]|uniref:Beta-xylosidase/alpha-L-arabinofuranosidase 2 n=2 Tax=Phytophthora cactorum TaxID=29920 RepID=A0A329S3M5_9STRA|nr:Beta-xylosidase/alpha-L-arabinofuranosidase 2 [Phytophthora cactorum]KAG2821997.1 Beta-xylosidase/alpha-L-arabinofuranosidase 2 [Phytophthora cactorum]KAG2824415.1 Beta-xylosidase/alpha-L-arabinofuranosidase 2 [Phytophthora cactorum]KAG2862135.1 Beta-xylosidase/alpha-L-arabinofuranosidase 2 [Phytophthora cactorum]KAG2918457.1 Beta-xylosidase/alpha-L-arabinofuranosidase 2 [Phytophthora cactorum]
MLALLFVLAVASCFALPTNADIPRACVGEESQNLPFCDPSLSTYLRVEDLLSRLPLQEKATLLTARATPRGNMSSIGLPEYNWGANCVHGVQSTCGTNCPTSFPNPINLGAIFDPQVVSDMAQVIGWELRALWLEGARENYKGGPHLGLDCWSPNININRDPRWGRNTETPSEDPLVNSKYGVAYTRGLQEGKREDPRFLQAVVTIKHYAAYSYENYGGVNRMEFDAIVSPYDFTDTYFPAFRSSIVDGNAMGVMCSYNSVNGIPMCANNALEKTLLRDTLGFDGYITSDSGAVEAISDMHHYADSQCEAARLAILAGTDINSGKSYEACLKDLVDSHQLEEKTLNEALRHTLKLRFKLGLFDPIEDQPYWNVTPSDVNTAEAKELSLNATRKSIVLLQNNGSVLPLTKGVKLAVIGPHAKSKRGLLGNYLGQMCRGDYDEVGCVKTPFKAISAMNGASSTTFARGCDIKNSSTAGFDEAVTATQNADTVVLFLGIDKTVEGEVGDRDNIELPSIQMKLLKRIRAVGKPTVLVLINGGVIGAEKIIHQTDALVEAFYPGFFGAQAMADVLFGDVNPSGKLPVTMYRSDYVDQVEMKSMDMTAYPGRTYRYFKGEPVFPFGWGLSYTTFSLSVDNGTTTRSATSTNSSSGSLVTAVEISNSANATISVVVSNDGDVAGEEVVFAFFKPLSTGAKGSATLLNMQLFDYQRVSLEPSDSTRVSFTVQRSDLSLVDESGNSVSYPGSYEIIVSNGVREHLSFSVEVGDAEKVIQSRVQPFPAFGNSANSAASARASSQGSRVILCLVALIIALL